MTATPSSTSARALHNRPRPDESASASASTAVEAAAGASPPSLPPPHKRLKRVHPWRSEFARDFGVRVVERSASTGAVLVVECRFCAAFGREQRSSVSDTSSTVGATESKDSDVHAHAAPSPSTTPSVITTTASSLTTPLANDSTSAVILNCHKVRKQRKVRKQIIATWRHSFRTDNMRSHHVEQHSRKWRAYQQLLALATREQLALKSSGNNSSNNNAVELQPAALASGLSYTQQLNAFFATVEEANNATSSIVAACAAANSTAGSVDTNATDASTAHGGATKRQRAAMQPRGRRKTSIILNEDVVASVEAPATTLTPSLPTSFSSLPAPSTAIATTDTSAFTNTPHVLEDALPAPAAAPAAQIDHLPVRTAQLMVPLQQQPRRYDYKTISTAILDTLLPQLFGRDCATDNATDDAALIGFHLQCSSDDCSLNECATHRPVKTTNTLTPQLSTAAFRPVAAAAIARAGSSYSVTLEQPHEIAFIQQLLALDALVALAQIAPIVAAACTHFKSNDDTQQRSETATVATTTETALPPEPRMQLTHASVCAYARLIVASDWMRIADWLCERWTYALVLAHRMEPITVTNGALQQQQQYIDVRLCIPRLPNAVAIGTNTNTTATMDTVELHVVALVLDDRSDSRKNNNKDAATAIETEHNNSAITAAVDRIAACLEALDPLWRSKLLGGYDASAVSVDSNSVTSALLDAMQQRVDATAPFYRAWRGAELVECVLMDTLTTTLATMTTTDSSAFLETLAAMLAFLHTQPITRLQSYERRSDRTSSATLTALPSLASWCASPWQLQQTLEWFAVHREAITHLQTAVVDPQQAAARLPPQWWVVALALSDILSDFARIHCVLCDRDGSNNSSSNSHAVVSARAAGANAINATPVLATRATLRALVRKQATKLGVVFTDARADASIEDANTNAGTAIESSTATVSSATATTQWTWPQDCVVAFLRSLNLSARRLFSDLSLMEQTAVVAQIRAVVIESLRAIDALANGRDDCTAATDSSSNHDHAASSVLSTAPDNEALPPTRPLEFAAINSSAVVDFVECHSARLERAFSVAFIDALAKELKTLCALVGPTGSDAALRAELLAAHATAETLQDAWSPLASDAFPHTRMLAVGFATVTLPCTTHNSSSNDRTGSWRRRQIADRGAAAARRSFTTRNHAAHHNSSSTDIVVVEDTTAADLEAEAQVHAWQLQHVAI